MAVGRVNKSNVDTLLAVSQTPQYLWDKELKGFGVKATPTGRKVFLVQYRLGGRAGKAQRVTIGVHGKITADEARRKAKSLLGELAEGKDVAAIKRVEKNERRSAVTVAELATDFLESFVKAKRKPSTQAEYARIIRKIIVPSLGHHRVKDIGHREIERWHIGMRPTPTQANRSLAVLSKIFSWAMRTGQRPDRINPCSGIEKFKEQPRKRYLSENELATLGSVLRQAETIGIPWDIDDTKPTSKHLPKEKEKRIRTIDPFAVAAIRLFLLTGARLSEILGLRWEEVDLEAKVLRLPDSKTGAKSIALNAPAISVLNTLPRLAGNPHVIPGLLPGSRRADLKRPWRAIRSLAGINDVHIHDLRHTVGAVAVASNVSLRLIGGLLGHSSEKTSARYAHISDNPIREASEIVGERISKALEFRK